MYKPINELPKPAEQIDKEKFDNIDANEYQYCEMARVEMRFLFGLLRHFKPKNVLEVGVSSGGGSGLILSAIADMLDTTLTSIDYAEQAYRFPTETVGFVAMRKHSKNKNWRLISGKDPSEAIGKQNRKFDFAVIDTAHVHPVETLNFLSVLPFLEEGAVVVLHDIALFLSTDHYKNMSKFPDLSLATRYLFNSVVAEKITPEYSEGNLKHLQNIGAFQITDDTYRYLSGVFGSLLVPWATIPEQRVMDSVAKIVQEMYDDKYAKMFNAALRINYYIKCKELKCVFDLSDILEKHNGSYILFGARGAIEYIDMIVGAGYDMPIEIWDNEVDSIAYKGLRIPIIKPHFDISPDVPILFSVKAKRTYILVTECWPKELKERAYFFQKAIEK